MKLKGKVAIVTGAGRGLGREIALAMVREGARITIMSRSRNELKISAEKLRTIGGQVLEFQGDVSEEQTVFEMVRKTQETFSTVDVLVNNAALIGPPRFVAAVDSSEWRLALEVNLIGAYYCCQAVLPVMIEKKSGKIINVTSGLGQRAYPRFCAYAVSKAGLIQLTRSLSEELKEMNIQVNAIDPGLMNTRMQADIRSLDMSILGQVVHQQFHDLYAQDMLKNPADVAPLAVFLASDAADHLTGYNATLSDYNRIGWSENM